MYPLIVFFNPLATNLCKKAAKGITDDKSRNFWTFVLYESHSYLQDFCCNTDFWWVDLVLTVRYNFEEPPEHVNSYCKKKSYLPSDKRGREYRDESSFSLRIKVRTYSTKLTFSVKNCSMLEGVLYVMLFCFFPWKHFKITLK